jgi:hypothetical protein
MPSGPRRRRVEPTDEWEQIELLCAWPEQRDYELIRPLVLFGGPADGRAEQTGAANNRAVFLIPTPFCSGAVEERCIDPRPCAHGSATWNRGRVLS